MEKKKKGENDAVLTQGVSALNLKTPTSSRANEQATPPSIVSSEGSDSEEWNTIRTNKKLSTEVGKYGKQVTLLTNRINFLQTPEKLSVFHFAFKDSEGKNSNQKVDITSLIDIANNPLAYDGSKILVQYGPVQKDKKDAHEDNYVLDTLSNLINANGSRIKLDSRENIVLDGSGTTLRQVHLQYLNIIFTKNLPSATYQPMPRRQQGGGRGRGRGRGRGGRSFSDRPDYDAQTLDIRYRYRTSMIYGETGPQLALDAQGSIVYKDMPFLEFLKKKGLINNRGVDARRVFREVEGMKLLPTHRKQARPITVRGISDESVRDLSFSSKDGKQASVFKYFTQTYPFVKLNPNFPCIKASSRRDIYYPFEVLFVIKEQVFKGEIPRAAINYVHLVPQQRHKLIEKGIQGVKNLANKSSGGEFKLDEALLKVKGREIGTTYANKGAKFYKPQKISKWVVVVGDNQLELKDIHMAVNSFISAGKGYGMQIAKPMCNPILIRYGRELGAKLNKFIQQGLEFILLIKREHDKYLYNEAKIFSWIKTGVPLQVCLSKHFKNARENRLRSYMTNLLLKVNVKMGGTNFKFTRPIWGMPNRKTLILGMDVSHGMLNVSTSEQLPSTATVALIAFDPKTNMHRAACASQNGRSDILEPETMQQLLKDLKIKFSNYDSVIMYRDGVGESMFALVEKKEYVALRDFLGTHTKITFTVFNKRHKTRFFKMDGGRFVNPNAGTVVDKVVTNKDDFDFYLQAHTCGIGSACLPHYIVLHDDHKFSADNLQRVTNSLSSLYQRSFGPVSMSCTAYYAHILADKCRILLNEKGMLPNFNPRLLTTSSMFFL